MIVISLGANLPHPAFGSPIATLCRALGRLEDADVAIEQRSAWFESEPVPNVGQPWFVNGAAVLRTALAPAALLARLHEVEAEFGRRRGARNASRPIDLDLIAYDGQVIGAGEADQRAGRLVLPHPLMHLRRFVLAPMAEVAPGWRHPRLGRTVSEMLADLPREPIVRRAPAADAG